MSTQIAERPLIAVEVGNTRLKMGLFRKIDGDGLPEPDKTLQLDSRQADFEQVRAWLGEASDTPCRWLVSSVFRQASAELARWVEAQRPEDSLAQLTSADLPLTAAVPSPEKVGIDRLLAAVAANLLRAADRPAVVIDLGTAITVDLVSPTGEFLGGAILPGIRMATKALFEQTDLLPDLPLEELGEPPPALGKDTTSAIQAGVYWGAVGAVRELTARLTAGFDQPAHIYLTGGAAPAVAKLLGAEARFIPNLLLGAIAVAAKSKQG